MAEPGHPSLPCPVAGVVLAGGRGVRMGRVRKGLLRLGGRTMVERLLGVYEDIFPERVIAAKSADDYGRFGVEVALDRFPSTSSLTGIHAGLTHVGAGHAFVAACDVPFPSGELIRTLLGALTPDADVVAPMKADGYYEPLFAIYSKRCLPHIEAQLAAGNHKIIEFFPKVKVVEVGEDALRAADPDLESFVNVNTPAELGKAVLKARAAIRPESARK